MIFKFFNVLKPKALLVNPLSLEFIPSILPFELFKKKGGGFFVEEYCRKGNGGLQRSFK